MRLLLLPFLLVLPVWAQPPSLTTLTQTVTNADGTPASGTVDVTISRPCQSGSNYVASKTVSFPFTGGNFSAQLVPNDTCLPNRPARTFYNVTWRYSGGPTRSETWQVPTSSTPVAVTAVVISVSPPVGTPYTIQWQQLAQNGAGPGMAPIWNGSSWVPALPGTTTTILPGANGGLGSNAGGFTGVLAMNSGVAYAVSGPSTDCVLVNGMAGPCGSGTSSPLTWDSAGAATWNTI